MYALTDKRTLWRAGYDREGGCKAVLPEKGGRREAVYERSRVGSCSIHEELVEGRTYLSFHHGLCPTLSNGCRSSHLR